MSSFSLSDGNGAVTVAGMFSGMPIAFVLGAVAVGFMCFLMPATALDTVTQNGCEEMSSIPLASIPLFILQAAAIGKPPAGRDRCAAMRAPFITSS